MSGPWTRWAEGRRLLPPRTLRQVCVIPCRLTEEAAQVLQYVEAAPHRVPFGLDDQPTK